MISIKQIELDNYRDALNLQITKEQEAFVSMPARSLMLAYVYRKQSTPFGIYCNDRMIGYVMVLYDYDVPEYDIWHLIIDKQYQGKGYGRQALHEIIAYIAGKPFGNSNRVVLFCHKDNKTGLHLYQSMGFTLTGNEDDGEYEMVLDLATPT